MKTETDTSKQRKPTIYEALVQKLGRMPTHNELRILSEVTVEMAGKGKLPFQRKKSGR